MSTSSKRRLVIAIGLLFAATLALSGSAWSGGPWQLRCASMPREQTVPAAVRPAFGRFFPWVSSSGREALRSGPIYLLALSSQTAISRDGDRIDSGDYYDHRALVAIAPDYKGAVTISGQRLGRPGPRTALAFSTDGAGRCTVSGANVDCTNPPVRFARTLHLAPHRGWRIVQTELRIGRTGCFRITVTGTNLQAAIPLAVPGPDWGTPGW